MMDINYDQKVTTQKHHQVLIVTMRQPRNCLFNDLMFVQLPVWQQFYRNNPLDLYNNYCTDYRLGLDPTNTR